ncbi:THAP domain-containing protein 7 [Halichoeres trimaculatus]|uniref:THAP domain-containing protein 7 n=1 Tax=Halichoeres trimaculatus TaxID=147232 RepID=UPI003D9E4492
MPRHCSADGCKSRDNRDSRKAGITFHKLPKGATRRNLWITNSRRADSWDPQSDFVYFCSKHFTPESFELIGYSGIRRLREDASPTLFAPLAATKRRRAGRLQKGGLAASHRESPCSGEQDEAQEEQQEDKSQPSEEDTGQRSAAAPEENPENPPEAKSPSADSEPRPVSPSRYMRRLPPPPGFYLSKEHSYAQLCPLLWRRRYDQAIDCLEKALRQLHAARRRENRLRSTVHRLQDKRLKQALQVSREPFKDRRSKSSRGQRGQGGCNLEDSENDKYEASGEFEDRAGDQMESEGLNSWSEEERERCFYCGRGPDHSGVLKTGGRTHGGPTAHEDSHRNRADSPHSTAGKQSESRSPSPPGESSETPSGTKSSVLLLAQSLQHVDPAGLALPDVQEQFLGSQQKFVLSDGESESIGQQLLWLPDCGEGPVVLVPVPAGDGLQNLLKQEGATDGAKTILVSEVDLKGEFGPLTESSGDGELNMREDVRKKLKEHLEGFHLQLSSEFLT